jgi:hypothetical protein
VRFETWCGGETEEASGTAARFLDRGVAASGVAGVSPARELVGAIGRQFAIVCFPRPRDTDRGRRAMSDALRVLIGDDHIPTRVGIRLAL